MRTPINDTSPEIFRMILEYIYGGKIQGTYYILKNGKKIIDVANCYGLPGLKLIAESTLVSKCVIDVSNAADYILFAEAKICPLLKEYDIAYFVARSKDILKSDFLDELLESGSLMREIMSAMADKLDSSGRYALDTGAAESMSAYQLRKGLNAKL